MYFIKSVLWVIYNRVMWVLWIKYRKETLYFHLKTRDDEHIFQDIFGNSNKKLVLSILPLFCPQSRILSCNFVVIFVLFSLVRMAEATTLIRRMQNSISELVWAWRVSFTYMKKSKLKSIYLTCLFLNIYVLRRRIVSVKKTTTIFKKECIFNL